MPEGGNGEATRLARHLQPSLSAIEMAVWTASFVTGMVYCLYNVFVASTSGLCQK